MKTPQQKREEAEARNARWAKLTPQQQLAELDRKGLTATRQRARIMKHLQEAQKAERTNKS